MLWVNHLVQQSSSYPLIPCILCLGGTVWSWPQLYINDPQPRGGRSWWCFLLHPVREGIQFALPAGDTGWSRRWVSWSNTGQHWLLGVNSCGHRYEGIPEGSCGEVQVWYTRLRYILEHFKKEVKSNCITITTLFLLLFLLYLSSSSPLPSY